ncbi:MAG: FAD-dependent oxidoreductase [Rhodoferax sp.]|uniref:FAD-dependent oxidoreductase n=1 Tax=Rhodoferax sp. TaxID=50421 RepID=UPI00271FD9EB|nr:FAD-dependent oxidoreductase [Rhodoferax sp.]MDO8451033.1 FAD-dependent oxidoreductase [Rhodoferax sp.]
MAEAAATELLQACGLPQAWGQQSAWRVLDTRFDRGLHFLTTWQAWRNDPRKPRLLHYVSLTSAPPPLEELLACATSFPALADVAQELAPQWFGLAPGVHRLTLDGGHVLLTLCVGDLTAMLRQQQFVADSIYLAPDGPARDSGPPWTVWTVKALARCCRRGTRLVAMADASDLRADLTQCGFELQASQTDPLTGPAGALLGGQFNPRWTIKNTRDAAPARPVEVGTCAVIGAGLAGASVAAALARRGWQVRVLDQANEPAAGASGLPVGLVVPHVSADDCALSRLSRSGVRLMLYQARSLLRQGQDWDATGTLQRQLDGAADLPDIWHKDAAWLKPARLVDAWLAQPGITFQGGARVSTLRRSGDQWELLDELGQVLARADRVVLANANGALPLLETLQATLPALGVRVDQLPAMHGVRGQLSWALHQGEPDAAFPLFPVNGAGSVIPAVPVDGDSHAGLAWFVGSSYQPDNKPESPDEKNHAANFGRLQKLIPALSQALAKQFAAGAINAWKNTRCVTADRLPVVGPLYRTDNPTLWICAGMGSRGLSFSVLCAELLAARWGAEPLPVDAGLAQSLNALRGTPSMAENI